MNAGWLVGVCAVVLLEIAIFGVAMRVTAARGAETLPARSHLIKRSRWIAGYAIGVGAVAVFWSFVLLSKDLQQAFFWALLVIAAALGWILVSTTAEVLLTDRKSKAQRRK